MNSTFKWMQRSFILAAAETCWAITPNSLLRLGQCCSVQDWWACMCLCVVPETYVRGNVLMLVLFVWQGEGEGGKPEVEALVEEEEEEKEEKMKPWWIEWYLELSWYVLNVVLICLETSCDAYHCVLSRCVLHIAVLCLDMSWYVLLCLAYRCVVSWIILHASWNVLHIAVSCLEMSWMCLEMSCISQCCVLMCLEMS